MTPLAVAVTFATVLAGAPNLATAQPPAKPRPATPPTPPGARPSTVPGPSRGFVTFGAGAQITSADFSLTDSELLNVEQKTWTADYTVKTGLEFEVGAGWRAWRNLFVGGTYSRFHDSRSAAISAQIPHPFYFNQPRSISGESSALSHDENALHLSAWWIVPAGRRVEVGIFGGPSVIRVSRPLVTDVQYSEAYPYDTATFSMATVGDVSKTAVGVHGGVDVTWLLNRQIGVGGTLRYARAGVDLSTPAGGSVSLDAGGLQAAVVLKVRILAKAPPRAPTRPTPPRNAPNPQAPAGAISTAVTTATAPVFLRPDATLTPLRQLPTGTRLRILDQTDDWVHVEFDDRQYGRRVGYIQKAFVRLETGR